MRNARRISTHTGIHIPLGFVGPRFSFQKDKPMTEVLERPIGQESPVVHDQGEDVNIAVGELISGFNYRRRLNAAKEASFDEDIKRNGQLQGLIFRKLETGGLQILAGHRRAMSISRVFGPEYRVFGKAKTYSNAEAIAVMVSENYNREDPTAIEDAEAATRLLGEMNGDKDETARRLGWKRPLLDRRLAIMNATDSVRDAFIEEKLHLGHVEILAAMPREAQEKVLVKLLAAPVMPTVEQLKAMAEQVLLGLEAAIFDKADCNGCKFNTGNQQALFDTSFSGTRCTNGACYGEKTEKELETRRMALTETYQVVRIVRPGDNLTVNPLRAEGKLGVGAEQALACRTCADFGACISGVPDKLGMSFKDVCFNKTCLDTKVGIRAAAEEAAREAAAASIESAASAAIDASAKTDRAPGSAGEGQGSNEDRKQSQKTKTSTVKVAASSEPRNAVKEFREKIWRGVFHRGALKLSVEKSRALLLALCLYRPSTLDSHAAVEAIERETGMGSVGKLDAFQLTSEILAMDVKALGSALFQIPAAVTTSLEITAVVGFLKALGIQIESHWKINAAFFDLLTKTEIDAVCIELGMDKAVGKEYAKLKNGGKADFIKAIMAIEGFEYVGKIPAFMRW